MTTNDATIKKLQAVFGANMLNALEQRVLWDAIEALKAAEPVVVKTYAEFARIPAYTPVQGVLDDGSVLLAHRMPHGLWVSDGRKPELASSLWDFVVFDSEGYFIHNPLIERVVPPDKWWTGRHRGEAIGSTLRCSDQSCWDFKTLGEHDRQDTCPPMTPEVLSF